jgi:hypothetical protein
MKPQPPANEFAAFIGIDWADAKHDICLQAANAARRESSVLPHRRDAIEAWAGALRQRFQGQPIVGLVGAPVLNRDLGIFGGERGREQRWPGRCHP